MNASKRTVAEKRIKAVTYLSMAANVVLSGVKVVFGVLSGSIALIADGFHSLSDIATDIAVLIGVYVGSKKPDEKHPYGHGWAETLSAGFVALVLVVVGVTMIYYPAVKIARGEVTSFRWVVIIVAVISVIAKELLYKRTRKVAVETHSSSLYANAWHHRSDAGSSIAVIAGAVSLRFGFAHGDHLAAMAVGLMIVMTGISVLGECLRAITECAVDPETVEQIRGIIKSNESIREWHKLRTRTVGREVFLDLHILVDPGLNVSAAHEIAENLEVAIDSAISQPINVTVHVEPDVPELRKYRT
ncbi:cation diffusion facilitator family transporter [Planctomycetota bacterium]